MQCTEINKICFCVLILSYIGAFIKHLFVHLLHLFVICFYFHFMLLFLSMLSALTEGAGKSWEAPFQPTKSPGWKRRLLPGDDGISFLKSYSLYLRILLPKGTVIKPQNTVTNGFPMDYFVTVTVTVYFFLPDLTVIFAFPAFLPVITPLLLTVAIFLLEDL